MIRVGWMHRAPGLSTALAMLAVLLGAGSARVVFAAINAWTSIGPAGASISALAIDPTTPTTLYAGASGYGVCKSTDGGMTWQAHYSGLPADPPAVLAIDPVTPQTLYAGAPPSGVFKSTDGGMSWNAANDGLTDLFVSTLIIAPDAPSTLYAGIADYSASRNGVFRTTDGGASWQDSSSGLPSKRICNLASDPLSPQTLYADTEDGVFRTTDGGASWSRRGSFGCFSELAIDPHMPSTLYGVANTVLKSTDGGSTWDSISPTGDYEFFQAVAVDPVAPGTVYAAAVAYAVGVWKSADGGISWQKMHNGVPYLYVNPKALAITAGPPETLYAGTGTGVFAIQPATFTVDSIADAPDATPGDGVCATATGVCTLRAAIGEATALPGGSVITVPGGLYAVGPLKITTDMIIQGAGAQATTIDGSPGFGSVITISTPANVTISGVTIQNGNAGVFAGGGITNGGTLRLADSVVRWSRGGAGGILNTNRYNDTADLPVLTLANCSISSNTGGTSGGDVAGGGGIVNENGTATITSSTISDNMGSFVDAGGIGNRGMLGLSNSTVSNNEAGGISNRGTLSILGSTISGNRDAGVLNRFFSATIQNSIIAGNIGADCEALAGSITSYGYNLIGDSDGCNWTAAPGDQVGTAGAPIAALLGPLKDNGGPTFTQALLPGSPAVDAGGSYCPPGTDQRGVLRPQGVACDIGAFEFVAVACGGDCNQNGTVSVDELITLVNVALGNTPSACAHGVPSGVSVDITLIIQAVNNALNGCG